MKFPAYCRYCNMKIEWSTSRRTWDRRIPNKTYEDREEQLTKCVQSKNAFHDPDPQRV